MTEENDNPSAVTATLDETSSASNGQISLASIVEACLFVSDTPLSDRRLGSVLKRPVGEVRQGIKELQERYKECGSSLEIIEVADGYKIATRPDLEKLLSNLFGIRRVQRLSRAGLEVLAIVAYRQPVTEADVQEIRGVDCYQPIRTLMEQNFVKQVGRKDAPGSPILYGSTPHFLEYFGLKSLKDLPDESELDSLFREEGPEISVEDDEARYESEQDAEPVEEGEPSAEVTQEEATKENGDTN